jgi:RNA polymerase sigma-70 factor (ECF subfamily)
MVASTTEIGSLFQIARTATHPPGRAITSIDETAYDSVLVRRFNAGDESAFVEIVTRYRAKMFSIALAHLRNPADAEEIAQDTFIRAHRGLSRFRGDSSLSTWLHRIAFNLSRNRHKYNFCRRRHLTLSLDAPSGGENEATFSDSITSDAPSPAREAAACEFSDLVNMCVTKLGDRQREILLLRIGLNESYASIAGALGISIGTVKSRIGRARDNLRALLAEKYPDLAPGSSVFSFLEPIRPGGRLTVACA